MEQIDYSTGMSGRHARRYIDVINDKLEVAFDWIDTNYLVFTTFCFLLMLIIMAFCAPFDHLLRKDSYAYLVKAFQIAQGDWTPLHHRSIGLSMFLAAFLKLFQIDSIYAGMVLSRVVSILLMGLCVFPFAALARRLLERKVAITAVLAFTTFPSLIGLGPIGYTEPLFILLVLSTVYVLTGPNLDLRRLAGATTLASLSYYVRPNGILMLAVLLIYAAYALRSRTRWIHLAAIACIFFIVSFPHLALRHAAFGSAFDYAENSKYFIDSYADVWTGDKSAPGLLEYLTSHSFTDYYRKFVRDGIFKSSYDFYQVLGPLWAMLFVFGSVKYLLLDRKKRFGLPFVVIAIFMASLIPVYQIHHSTRYFTMLLPFVLIIASSLLFDLLGNARERNALILCFILFGLAQVPIAVEQDDLTISFRGWPVELPKVRDEWAIWASQNLNGNIALMDGSDLIDMSARGTGDPHSVNTGISAVRPGTYENMADALQYFRKMNITYLLLDSEAVEQRPYLQEVYHAEWSRHFTPVRSFSSKPGDRWIIKKMDVFKFTP